MKFYLLVTVELDIFIKEKNNTLYLPWISPLSFFYAKGVYSVNVIGKYPINKFPTPPLDIPPPPPAYYILRKFPTTPCLLEPPFIRDLRVLLEHSSYCSLVN